MQITDWKHFKCPGKKKVEGGLFYFMGVNMMPLCVLLKGF